VFGGEIALKIIEAYKARLQQQTRIVLEAHLRMRLFYFSKEFCYFLF
jgi:hypothetical protein